MEDKQTYLAKRASLINAAKYLKEWCDSSTCHDCPFFTPRDGCTISITNHDVAERPYKWEI
jgi:hypothetical protein